MIKKNLKKLFSNKRVLILGFGKEGESTFRFIRKLMPELHIGIADRRSSIIDDFKNKFGSDERVSFFVDERYLESLQSYDLVIKSPGISYKVLPKDSKPPVITSQTELFIKLFRDRIIGVTGSKGKSTTSSLIYHILHEANQNTVFVGNIGVPPFDRIETIEPNSWIVYELSSHQLEHIKVSPHIGVLLNIFEEHLDHYKSYGDYQEAKFNIARFHDKDDYFVFNSSNKIICELMKKQKINSTPFAFGDILAGKHFGYLSNNDVIFSDGSVIKDIDKLSQLAGRHNLYNIIAAIIACRIVGYTIEEIVKGISTFSGLPHRLEYIGNYAGKDFYNDSIATIPEAAIEAIKSVPGLSTVILGGYDRGVNYRELVDCLREYAIDNIVFVGEAGKRMYELLNKESTTSSTVYMINSFDEAVKFSIEITPKGKSCLLSPAAASYDMFRNFEERGERFREIIEKGHEEK